MLLRRLAVVALAMLATVTTALAQVPFQPLADLGLGGQPSDVNAAGRIVGAVRVDSPSAPYIPVIWESTTAPPVALPNLNGGYAVAINSNGDICGTEFQVSGVYGTPVLWSNGERFALPDLGEGGYAYDLNESGVIVGAVIQNDRYRAARWVDRQLELLPLPEFTTSDGVVWSFANSINSSGTIVGTVQAPSGTPSAAVRWDANGVSLVPSDGLETKGLAIDNSDNVLINGYFDSGSVRGPAYVRPNGTVDVLAIPADMFGGAPAITSSRNGIAAGYYYASGPNGPTINAVAWPNGVFTPLAMPAGQRWAFPTGVGSNGIVFGSATDGVTGRSVPGYWVLDLPAASLTASNATGTRGQSVTVQATSKRGTRANVGHSVSMKVNGTTVGRAITDAAGVARLPYTIPANTSASSLTVALTDEDGATVTRSIAVDGATLAVPPSLEVAGMSFSAPTPNPVRVRTTLRFSLAQTSDVDLSVFDVTGRMVTTLASGSYAAGSHAVEWSTEGVTAGLYLVRLRTERGTLTQRVQLAQ